MVSSVYRQYRQCVYVGYRALIKGTVLSIVSSVYRHSIDSVYAVYSMTDVYDVYAVYRGLI